MKKQRSLWISAAAALGVAGALAGCGTTTYFAGRKLPPSGLTNRVLIAIQNPNPLTRGSLQIVDAYYDIRSSYNDKVPSFSIAAYTGGLPVTIQNMPEEQVGIVYGSADGSFIPVNYGSESSGANIGGLSGFSSSVFATRSQGFVFAANQAQHVFTALNAVNGGAVGFSLPGVYRVSVNPGGSLALAFIQNSNYIYYPQQLTAAQTIAYSGGASTWPKGATDCEPQNAPLWCLFQVQDPSTGNPLSFNRPIKAVFSIDGGTVYILNCGPECGGTAASNPSATPLAGASVTALPVAPMIFPPGQASGTLPSQAAINANCATAGNASGCTIPVPGGASNALVTSSTLYVVGQQPVQLQGQTLFTGNLTVVNLSAGAVVPSTTAAPNPASISDGAPGAPSRILLADDNTLWIGMTKCTNGVRAATGQPDGCLTMVNSSTGAVTLLEPYLGDATGIAGVEGLHKIYTAEGGQVYIYSTVDGTSIDNQYVTVTGVASDVAYMDATTDSDNTLY